MSANSPSSPGSPSTSQGGIRLDLDENSPITLPADTHAKNEPLVQSLNPPSSLEGGIKLDLHAKTSVVALADTSATERLAQRVAELEKEREEWQANKQRMADLEKEREALQVDKQRRTDLEKEKQTWAVQTQSLVDWNVSYSNNQRKLFLDQKEHLKEQLQDMTNIANMRAGLPPINTANVKGDAGDSDEDSDDPDMEHADSRYRLRSSRKRGPANARSSAAADESSLSVEDRLSALRPLPSHPLSLSNTFGTSSRPDTAAFAIGNGIPAMPKKSEFSAAVGRKRTAAQMQSSDDAATHRPVPFPICRRCYTNNLRCDPMMDCVNCVEARRVCKRSRCKKFAAGTCQVMNCTRAHEGDEDSFRVKYMGHVPKHQKTGSDDDEEGGGHQPSKKKGRREYTKRQQKIKKRERAEREAELQATGLEAPMLRK